MSIHKLPYAAGVDFGGTSVKIGLVDEAGKIIGRQKIPTSRVRDVKTWVKTISLAIRELTAQHAANGPDSLAGVGIGVPGFVDHQHGYIHELPNVPSWNSIPLADLMRQELDTAISLDNDVNAMALGECTFGAGRQFNHAVFITLGTGVGGALMLNKQIYRGARGMAGEIGHMTIDLHGIKYPMGQGGLEQYVGNKRIVERALRHLQHQHSPLLETLCEGDRSRIDPLLIEQAAKKGCPLSMKVYDEIADHLAAGLASVAYLLQPEAFIMGGGIGKSGPVLYEPLHRHLRERLANHMADHIQIKKAQLGNNAGMVGAAMLVKEPMA